jgi:penicillin-binding protein 2
VKSVWRIGVLGVSFLALFAVLALQMWRLQVTSAAGYEVQVDRQQVRIVETPAPRGEIVDRDGRILAGSRSSLAVVADRKLIGEEDESVLVARLAAFLAVPATEVQQMLDGGPAGSRITLATDLSDEQALFLVEHREEFPGVAIEPQPVRTYPQGPLAAHLLGYIGAPDADDLERGGVRSTDLLGKAGIEKQYDFLLRGTPGAIKYQVDARRDILGLLAEQAPEPGGTVITTIDAEIQAELETSLAQGLDLARRVYRPGCEPGPDDRGCPIRAVGVVLDPRDGSVVAMASVPGYDPTIFVDGLTEAEWAGLQSGAVFNNFAIQGVYAPASTFKSIAYVAALEEGIYPEDATIDSPAGVYDCEGRLEFQFTDGSPQVYRDWTEHGAVDLHEALQESCDVYFWQLALRVWSSDDVDESIIQDWARDLGFGSRTGIDLPFEQQGLIPDREWFNQVQAENPGRVREGSWVGGDLMNVVVGQGEVLSTPLQLANAYAAMLNGGRCGGPASSTASSTAKATSASSTRPTRCGRSTSTPPPWRCSKTTSASSSTGTPAPPAPPSWTSERTCSSSGARPAPPRSSRERTRWTPPGSSVPHPSPIPSTWSRSSSSGVVPAAGWPPRRRGASSSTCSTVPRQ